MTIRTLAFAASALVVAIGFAPAGYATTPASSGKALRLSDMVAHLETTYPGEVIAIELDNSGDKPAHYHVDMRFPEAGIARVDVDATTFELASRDNARLPRGAANVGEVAGLVGTMMPGPVTVTALDSIDGVAPHYHVDVRLDHGTAQLKVDPVTRAVTWREPAIIPH